MNNPSLFNKIIFDMNRYSNLVVSGKILTVASHSTILFSIQENSSKKHREPCFHRGMSRTVSTGWKCNYLQMEFTHGPRKRSQEAESTQLQNTRNPLYEMQMRLRTKSSKESI